MRVLNAYLFDSTKSMNPQKVRGKEDAINPKIYLKIMNYNLDPRKLRVYSFLYELSKVISQRLLTSQNMENYGSGNQLALEMDSDQILNFESVIQTEINMHKESFYDPEWGYTFNQRDAELKLRENTLGLKYVNTILHYLCIYNQLNRLSIFGKMLISEVNKNLSLVTGTGLTGILFSSILCPNPSYPPSEFVANLYKILERNGLRNNETPKRIDQLERAAAGIEDSHISTLEKRLFNPLFDSNFEEWGGNMYNFQGKFIDELNTFRILCENITLEVDAITDLIIEIKKNLLTSDASVSPDNPLFEVLSMLCEVSINHLSYLGHIITNVYYGLSIKTNEDSQELDNIVKRVINSVSGFLHHLHLNCTYTKEATETASRAYETILLANYFGLFILSQFPEDSNVSFPKTHYNDLASFLRLVTSESELKLEMAVHCFTLLIKIQPDIFKSTDLESMLIHMKNPQLSGGAYRAICGYLIQGLDSSRLKKQFANQQTLNSIVSCRRFVDRQSFWQMNYYQGEQRDPEFCNWLWTLNVIVHAFEPLRETAGSLDSILAFVRTYLNRILSVLGFQFVTIDLAQPSPRVIEGDIRSRNECFRSTAYIEELELTLTIVDLLLCE
jgi:hypothetical protein